MQLDRFKNQSGLINVEELGNSIVVIGGGAIGSFYTMVAGKQGFRDITVYDFDTIEEHNIANQMYPEHMIGKPKVEALKAVVDLFSGIEIKPINERWHPDNAKDANIIVVAVDNMDARKAIWDHYKNREEIKFFIDGRMSAQMFRAYAINLASKEEKEYYEKTLYPQSKALPERCTQKSIIYTVLQVSGIMLSLTKRLVRGENRPTEILYDCLNDDLIKTIKSKYVYEQAEEADVIEEDQSDKPELQQSGVLTVG